MKNKNASIAARLNKIEDYLKESIALQKKLLSDKKLSVNFSKAVNVTSDALYAGNKILAAGNGGSAADAQHFTTEFVGKYKMVRKAHPAFALSSDPSILTAWSNDNSFDEVFKRQIEAHGKPGDVLYVLSTSGNSKNILLAIKAAKKAGVFTIALLGSKGGKAKGMADLEIIVPSSNTPRIQEVHKLIFHSIAEEVEKRHHGTPVAEKKR